MEHSIEEEQTGHERTRGATPDPVDFSGIDQDSPLIEVQESPRRRRHKEQRMSKEHIARIKRRHRRERFLIKLDLTLFIIVCLGGAATMVGLQMLQ